MSRLDELGGTGHITEWPRSAGRVVLDGARRDLGHYLRQEPAGRVSDKIAGYLNALEMREAGIVRRSSGN